jgi:cytochrome c-type protein NapB
MTTSTSSAMGPGLQIGFSIVLGLAVLGFFVGTGEAPDLGSPLVQQGGAEAGPAGDAMPSYSMLRSTARGGTSWTQEVAALAATPSGPAGGDKASALAGRRGNRAYDGAPPTVPHPVRQNAAPECLACHEEGLRIRDRSASAMSHRELTSCTQCHVVQAAPMPGAMLPPDATFAVNGFQGMESPTRGERAWAIAPPTTPHRTTMRERCMSCHGPQGRAPLQTPHPERRSCEQCHAPSASLDQAPGGAR